MDSFEQHITSLIVENKQLRYRVNEFEAYQRWWNLKISGIPEEIDENIKKTVVGLFSRICLDIADTLYSSVDVAHHLGLRFKNGNGDLQSWRIIVRFTTCFVRDRIWSEAKSCEIMKHKTI